MRLANLTANNIPIFLGIVVPAHTSIPVSLEMEEAVRNSPLIAEYVTAKMLSIEETPVAAPVAETKPAPEVKTPHVEPKKG